MELTQTIVIIVLVIIGVILFVVLIVELVDIPAPLIVPFADGTKVKIRSLANNLYLRPINCTNISTCNELNVQDVCDSFPNGTGVVISAIGQASDPLTTWQLCQSSAIDDSGDAKYLIYSEGTDGTFIMQLDAGLLMLVNANAVCTSFKANGVGCQSLDGQRYFSFILEERGKPGTNTTSGAYSIKAQCSLPDNTFILTSGQGATSLPANICPPLVVLQQNQDFNCATPNTEPRCSLNYLFSIEVQG